MGVNERTSGVALLLIERARTRPSFGWTSVGGSFDGVSCNVAIEPHRGLKRSGKLCHGRRDQS